MAGTRKYTQDEINNMTVSQRSAAWAGADQASRDALHEANVKSLGVNGNTYDSTTGRWTINGTTDRAASGAMSESERSIYGHGSTNGKGDGSGGNTWYTNAEDNYRTYYPEIDPDTGRHADATPSKTRSGTYLSPVDMGRRADVPNSVQYQIGYDGNEYAITYDENGYAKSALAIGKAHKSSNDVIKSTLATLNSNGVYTRGQKNYRDYLDLMANAVNNKTGDYNTYMGNLNNLADFDGGWQGDMARQILEQLASGTYGKTGTAAATGAAAPRSTNGGSDYYADFLRGVQNGADYNTLLGLYNQRVAKTSPGSGFEQYADDDAMRYMRSVLESMGGGQPTTYSPAQQGGTLGQIQSAIAELQNKDYSYGGGKWDSILDELAQQAINFNYDDWTKSDQYRALEDRYGRQGDMSMRDVLGQVSSRTGGLASSYATTAAQQQYNDYMAQLESVARDQWADEKNTLINNAQMAQGMSEQEYNRWLDAQKLGDNADSEALNALYDLLGYEAGRDDEMYKRNQDAKETARADIYDFLVNGGGSVGDLDADLIRSSGYTTAQLDNMTAQYQAAQAAAAAAAAAKTSKGRSSGGGGGGGNPKSSDAYKDVQKKAASYDDPDEAREYLDRMVNGGYITQDEADNIYYVNLGGVDEGNGDASYTGGGQGLANFEHYASAIGAQLQSGNEKNHGGVIKWLDDNWSKMSGPQQKAMQELLDDYGWSYRPSKN